MQPTPILLFLGQAAILVCVPFLIWRLPPVQRLMPLVVVQILAGIALGPSLLGRLVPAASAVLEGPAHAALSGLAWLAVVMFAFLTGLHFDIAETAGRTRAFLFTALSSVALPAALGGLAGLILFELVPGLAGPAGNLWLFTCAVGVAVAVTALPVLGAIMRETGLITERVGRDALGYAAINDLLLWILLAGVLSMAQAPSGYAGAVLCLGRGAAYLATMFLVAKPLAARLLRHVATTGTCRESDLVAVVSLTLASAWVTESIGLHYVLGSFIAGAILPPSCARPLISRIEPFTVVVLLPFFFILTGLRTEIRLDGEGFAPMFLASTLAAVFGKMAGTVFPARLAGDRWSHCLRLGILMQCKGLMDVVVLSVLFDAEVIGQVAFSAMVLMAVLTTAATKPFLTLCARFERRWAAVSRKSAV